MKTREIGTRFLHPTKGTLYVEREHAGCSGCIFKPNDWANCSNDITKFHSGECSAEQREDGIGVIFVSKGGAE